MKKPKTYIIGNPRVREKIKSVLWFAWTCIVYALAGIGLGAILWVVCQISAW
jgi:hypothetical protein